MRIAIYVRVSTQRQAQTQSIDQQLDRLRRVAADRRWPLPEDHVFRDGGYSGASLRRPGLDRLRDLAALAKLDRILITDPDRLARNYVHQVLLLEELQRHGRQVAFTDRPLSDDPQDHYRGMATVRGVLSNPTYTGTIYANRTRVRAAQVRRSATHPLGRPRDSQVPLPPEEWIAVATVPAIVDREQFDRVQAKIAENRSFARRNDTATNYLLRALVSCGRCRLACQARRAMPAGKTYYICTGKDLQVRQRLGCTCPSKSIPAGVLDDLVWSDLTNSTVSREPQFVLQRRQDVT